MEEIKEYWDNEFILYDKKELNKYELHYDTINYLITVGLMSGKRFKSESFLSLYFLERFEEEIIENKKHIRIASTPLGSDGLYIELGEDHVYFIKHPSEFNKLIKKFCNTKVQNYVKFETIESRISQKYPNVADDELEGFECAREVIEVYKKLDPSAIYPYSYWANRMLNYAINYFYDEDTEIEAALQSGKYSSRNDNYFDILIHGTTVLDTKFN